LNKLILSIFLFDSIQGSELLWILIGHKARRAWGFQSRKTAASASPRLVHTVPR
jgi:hypothetical protein